MIDHPPIRYDHPFNGKMVIEQNYGGELTSISGPCFPWNGSYACAKLIGNICYIYVMRGKLTPDLLRHEVGHCNGWPADHPK